MGFLSGLFSDKKKVESNSNQTGQQSYGLSDEAKNYWSTVAPTFNQGWTPVANDPSQIAAAGAQAGLSSGLNPAFNTATGIGASGISTADIQRFQNPYEDQVVRDTLEDMRYADSQALSQSNAAAAKAGALGGTSGIVRRNLLEDNFQDARNKAVTGIRQAGFNTAADLATKSTQAQLAGVGAASGIAGQQSGINQTQFGMGTQGWNQAWQNANQPYTTAAQGAQVLAGLSPASGQTTSGTSTGTQTTTATPSPFSVMANLAGTAISAFAPSDERVKENIVPIGEAFDGQPIYKFNYKGDPRTTIGLMAQDVEETDPEAVGEVGGVKVVNYDRALKDAERGPSMADGGAVSGEAPSQKDPHSKFKSAFEAISGMLERARGGSVSGMTPMRSAGGPAIGPFTTTVHPATPSPSFDMNAFGQGLSKMGESKQDSGGDDTALLQQQQQALSSMLSGMSGRRAAGGGVWDETGPEFGGSSGMAPVTAGREGGAELLSYRADAPVTRRELPLPVVRDLDMTQPRSVRTFNPGAMNAGRFAQSRGAIGSDGRVAVFPDEATGYKAMSDLLDVYGRRGQNTIATIIGGLPEKPNLAWAPRGVDNNSTDAYIKKVAATLGIDPNAPLAPEHREPLMRAMAAYESGGVGASGSPRPSGGSVELASSSSRAPIATDVPKRGGWFNEGVWTGEKVTPMQRLGIGLMSVRGPMFGGPMNDMAKQLMGMEEGRLNEKRIDSQADQFAKQIAQQAAIAAGRLPDGTPTVAARQADASIAEADANRKIREAGLTGTYGGQPTVAGLTQESERKTADLKRELAQIELEAKKNPEQAYERRRVLADKYGLTGDQRTQFIFDGKIPDKTAATESTVDKEVSKASVEMAQKGIQSAQGAKESLRSIDELRGLADDPNLEGAIGPLDQYSMAQTVGKYIPFASGQFNPDLNAKIQRIQQQLTLAGGEKMKGLGAQSDADAARLERAVSGLTSARDKKEFLDALRVIEDSVIPTYNRGVESARKFPKLSDEFAKSPLRDRQANEEARAAIKAGADREAVRKRLIERGIDPAGI